MRYGLAICIDCSGRLAKISSDVYTMEGEMESVGAAGR